MTKLLREFATNHTSLIANLSYFQALSIAFLFQFSYNLEKDRGEIVG